MTLEKKIEDVGLHRHNDLCLYQMQIAYLNSYDACQKYGIDKDQFMFYYIFASHPQQMQGGRDE